MFAGVPLSLLCLAQTASTLTCFEFVEKLALSVDLCNNTFSLRQRIFLCHKVSVKCLLFCKLHYLVTGVFICLHQFRRLSHFLFAQKVQHFFCLHWFQVRQRLCAYKCILLLWFHDKRSANMLFCNNRIFSWHKKSAKHEEYATMCLCKSASQTVFAQT